MNKFATVSGILPAPPFNHFFLKVWKLSWNNTFFLNVRTENFRRNKSKCSPQTDWSKGRGKQWMKSNLAVMDVSKVSLKELLFLTSGFPLWLLFPLSAGNVPPGVNPEAYQWFYTVDTDRSGFINVKELKQALVNSNWSAFNDETCLMMISKSLHREGGGSVKQSFGYLTAPKRPKYSQKHYQLQWRERGMKLTKNSGFIRSLVLKLLNRAGQFVKPI